MVTEPLRKGSKYRIVPCPLLEHKKEPFVVGVSRRSLAPQRQHQQLALYQDFLWKVNYSNALYIKPPEQEVTYKAYIGTGNNSNLLKRLIYNRPWWVLTTDPHHANLVWTQLRSKQTLKQQASSNN